MEYTVTDWRYDRQPAGAEHALTYQATYASAIAVYLAAASHEMRYPTADHQRPGIFYHNEINPVVEFRPAQDDPLTYSISRLLHALSATRKNGLAATTQRSLVYEIVGGDAPELPDRPFESNLEIVLYMVSWLAGFNRLPVVSQMHDPRVIDRALEPAIRETLEHPHLSCHGRAFFETTYERHLP
jgi:hypothetical protein